MLFWPADGLPRRGLHAAPQRIALEEGQFAALRITNISDKVIVADADWPVGDALHTPTPVDGLHAATPAPPSDAAWMAELRLADKALTEGQLKLAEACVRRNADCFTQHEGDLGRYSGAPALIELQPGTRPLKQAPRRVQPRIAEEVEKEIQKFLDTGVAVPRTVHGRAQSSPLKRRPAPFAFASTIGN